VEGRLEDTFERTQASDLIGVSKRLEERSEIFICFIGPEVGLKPSSVSRAVVQPAERLRVALQRGIPFAPCA
jgi:hypothetical protein